MGKQNKASDMFHQLGYEQDLTNRAVYGITYSNKISGHVICWDRHQKTLWKGFARAGIFLNEEHLTEEEILACAQLIKENI